MEENNTPKQDTIPAYFKNLPDGVYDVQNGEKLIKKDGKITHIDAEGNEIEISEQRAPSPTEEENTKTSKKKRKFRWYHGFASLTALALAGAIVVEALSGFPNLGKLKNAFKNKDSKTPTEAIDNSILLDEDGILSVTVPINVKPLEWQKEDGSMEVFYQAAPGFDPYYVYDDNNGIKLIEVTGDPRDNEKVQYWTTENGTPATGYIGVEESYSSLLEEYEIRKSAVASRDKAYCTPLEPIYYEVPDLYRLPEGYELYCEDPEIMQYGKLAYIDYNETDNTNEHWRSIYQIPERYLNHFIGVTRETYSILVNGSALKDQLVDTYEMYSQEQGNMGYDETTNRAR